MSLKTGNIDNTRGAALHTTQIIADTRQACVHIKARLSDAQSVDTQLTVKQDKIEGDPYVGHVLSDHWLVQCRLQDGDYRLVQQKGFQVKYTTIAVEELAKLCGTKAIISEQIVDENKMNQRFGRF